MREDCQLQTVVSLTEQPALVYETLEQPEVSSLLRRGLPEEVEVDVAPDSPEEVLATQVSVCLLQFQTAPVFRSMWVDPDETLASFAYRASQLLHAAGVPQDLHLVDPSPIAGVVTFVRVPSCWTSLQRTCFVMLWPQQIADPFAEVADVHTSLNDLLSGFPCDPGTSLDVVVTGPQFPDAPAQPFQPLNGTVMQLAVAGQPMMALHSTQQILYNTDAGQDYATSHLRRARPETWLIIDPFSVQVLLRRSGADEREQIAAACRIPAAELVTCRCLFPFSCGAVQGVPISQYVSARSVRISGHRNRGRVVFLDPRHLGLRFATQVLFKDALTVEDLAAGLDFEPVEGYRLFAWRNHSDIELEGPCAFDEGDGFTLRLLSIRPPRRVGSSSGSSVSVESDTDVSAQGSGVPSPACSSGRDRSRSPRRMPTTGPSGLERGHCPSPMHHAAVESIGADSFTVCCAQGPFLADAAVGFSRTRPLPTPCRSSAVPAPCCSSVELDAELQSLPLLTTLEAASRFWAEVCEKAVVLLCPPSNHANHSPCCVGDAREPTASSHCSSRPLCLADCLAPPCLDLTVQHLPLGRDLGQAIEFLQPWPFELAFTLPPGLALHPTTQAALCQAGPYFSLHEHVFLDALAIFTDGSFDGSVSAWAVVCVGSRAGQVCWLRWFNGQVCTDSYRNEWLGAEKHGVQEAELTAVCYAQLWILSVCRLDTCGILSDSLVSVQRALGFWKYPEAHLLARASRSLTQATEVLGLHPWCTVQHVRAHAGHQWNELADTLAKAAVVHDPGFSFHIDVGSWVRDKALESLWLILATWQQPQAWPCMRGSCLVTSTAGVARGAPPEPFFGLRCSDRAASTVSDQPAWRALRIATANVQSLECPALRAGVQGYEGRVGFIREQMFHRGFHVVAIQEARSERAETFLSAQYLRLCGGRTDTGQLGIELWFLRQPGQDGIHFTPEQVTVTHYSPRCLCVGVRSRFVQALFAAIHAPVFSDPSRDSWWAELRDTLRRTANGLPVFVVGDWNTRFADGRTGRVGDLVFPSKYPVSCHTWATLEDLDLWLPSTYFACHTGPSDTWYAPGGTASARLDYVGVPTSCVVGPEGSSVLVDVDLGHSSIDHLPVGLEVWVPMLRGCLSRPAPPQFDRLAMSTPSGQLRLNAICERAPVVAWDTDASEHYLQLERYLCAELQHAFPARRRRRQESFLSDSTWVLRDHRTWLRRKACRFRQLCRCPDAWAALCALRRGCGLNRAYVALVALLCGGARDADPMMQALRATRTELRRSLRGDKRRWIASVAREAVWAPTRDVVARLRPLLQPGGKLQRHRRALPAVRLESGTLACTEQEALDRWVRHFAANEGGSRLTPADLVQRLRTAAPPGDCEPFEVDVGSIPSRCHLECVMVSQTSGKAAGPDCIPAEVVKHAAGTLSRAIFPLWLKLVLRADEALQFKGGILHQAWKGKGSPSDCASYRALLVSSNVGKVLHGALRAQCVPSLCRVAAPLQVGGLPRFPVLFPAHMTRTFQNWQRSASYAILFLDLREAFYRVCRPMLGDNDLSEDALAAIFQRLGLPADVFRHFRDRLLADSLPAAASAPEWLQRALCTVLSHTWFRMQSQTDIVATSQGSRPGDNLADVLFFYVFSAVLREVREAAALEGLLTTVPWCEDMRGSVCPVPADALSERLPLHDVAWMDDLSLLLSAHCASAIIPAVTRVSGLLIDCCLRHGLLPNLDKGKTEVLVSLKGPAAKVTRASLLSDACPSIPTSSCHWPHARLLVVPVYKHLGGMIHHRGGLRVEIRTRVGHAWSSFRKHWPRLFSQTHVPLADKVPLFQSLVLSCLFYGIGTWTDVGHRVVAPLVRCYQTMCRSLLRKHFRGDVLRLSDERVRALVQVPSVAVWFHFHRLSYLASFVRVDVTEAWALVHAEQCWLRDVRSSLAWLFGLVGGRDTEVQWQQVWPVWRELMVHKPAVWKGLLRKALQRALRTEILEESWQQCRGSLARYLMQTGAYVQGFCDVDQAGGHFCGPCGRRFATRQQWAVHAFRSHGIVKATRRLTSATQCPCCLKQYPSNIALCSHLNYSQRCRLHLIRGGFSCEPCPGVGNRLADRGFDFLGTVRQGYGPHAADTLEGMPALGDAQTPASVPILSAMEALFEAPAECLSLVSLLEQYRLALCAACVDCDQLNATLGVWRLRLRHMEELPVRVAALHDAATAWVCEHWSIEWLCGHVAASRPQSMAVFRQSQMVLAELEFGEAPLAAADDFRTTGGFLLCHSSRLSSLDVGAPDWATVVSTEECLEDASWLHWAHGVAARDDGGHLLFCLADLEMPVVSTAVAGRPSFLHAKKLYTLFQDVALVVAQLWASGTPFIAVLPHWEPSIVSVLKRLPGVQWTGGTMCSLLHSTSVTSVPCVLFHSLN